MSAKTPITIEKINFKGWPNSYRMTNGEVELVITGDVGPRIIRYGFILRQDPKAGTPQKIGSFCKDTFGAYYLGNELFVKRYDADPAKTYPDMGASFETFTDAEVLELETLGPLTKLAPGETLEHTERWSLHKNVKIGKWTDEELDRVLLNGVL